MSSLKPILSELNVETGVMSPNAVHLQRRISDMKGMYHDQDAERALTRENPLVYEVFAAKIPEEECHLIYGTSITYAGKVGDEYYMTKGHFHEKIDTAEIYYCLKGHGYMLMQTLESQVSAVELTPGKLVYIPPRWAHRSINVGSEPFITLFVYRGDAGHDYGTIETKGFAKLMLEVGGKPMLVDNPKHCDRSPEN